MASDPQSTTSGAPLEAHEDESTLESIIGDDDRKDPNNFQDDIWRPLCALFFTYPGESTSRIGSGVLIRPRVVLTAAHNLFDRSSGKVIMGGKVRVGLSPTGSLAESGISDTIIHSKYPSRRIKGDKKFEFDYGLAFLKNENAYNWAKQCWNVEDMQTLSDKELKNSKLMLAGYPAKFDGPYTSLKWGFGPVLKKGVRSTTFTYQIDTSSGQSGAPVFRYKKATRKATIAGIHVAGYDGSHNKARRFSSAAKQTVQKWMDSHAAGVSASSAMS